MPRGDRTGPLGMGPLTGRRLGFCAGSKVPGYLNASYRRELWLGQRGYRCICQSKIPPYFNRKLPH